MDHYIYLLIEREFIKTNKNIYKIGKTKQENIKMDLCLFKFSNDTKLMFLSLCNECDVCEQNIIKIFKEQFLLRKDIGNEYFEGDYIKMIKIIYKICLNNLTKFKNIITDKQTDTEEELITDNQTDTSDIEHNVINVYSYEDLVKYTDIKNIIITNSKTKEGFIKFQKDSWIQLYDRYSTSYNDKTMEHLEGFIQIQTNDNKYEIKFDIATIIKDILTKCLMPNCKEYILQNHEYFILTNTEHKCALLDSQLLNILDYTNDIAKDKILCSSSTRDIKFRSFDLTNVNILIVEKILKEFINNNNIYNEYKRFCYNTIVIQKESLIFYDKYGILTSILRDLLEILGVCGNSNTQPYYIYYDDYLVNKKHYKKLFKICLPKLVLIHFEEYTKTKTTKIIHLGIKNIIVYNNNYGKIQIDKLDNCIINLISDIIEVINKDILDKNLYITETYIKKNIDNIFYKSELLLINFLKWCCIK